MPRVEAFVGIIALRAAVTDQPSVLVIAGADPNPDHLARVLAGCRSIALPSLTELLEQLDHPDTQLAVLDPNTANLRRDANQLVFSGKLLNALPDAVAAVDAQGQVLWTNFHPLWGTNPPLRRLLTEAFGPIDVIGDEPAPFDAASRGKPVTMRLARSKPMLHIEVRLAGTGDAKYPVVATCRDITAQVAHAQKFEALSRAGLELASLSPENVAEMRVDERIELLKLNLRQQIHDLLHYDVIEIRLLDRQTGQLLPLLADGMTEEAAHRVLFAKPEGNGVTGWVAATGTSYLCRDTANDLHYIEGAAGARSSLTVPLVIHDQIIGTLNIESPYTDAFTPEDVQFTELFAREVARALHTLELLSAQETTTASQSVDAINRSVALPVDDILSSATALLAKINAEDESSAKLLRQIIANARSIREAVRQAGGQLPPPPNALGPLPSKLRGLRVLVVDSEERTRRAAHTILDRFGCLVETARTGQEAEALALNSNYDAIVFDIRLPDMTGYELFSKLRQIQPRCRLILMTGFGYDASHSIVRARQDGLRFVLYKPFRNDQLLEALLCPDLLTPPPATLQPQN
jgi:CheY-like chemotaxis protein